MNEINKGTRLINFVIDITIISFTSSFIEAFALTGHPTLVFYSVYLLYYFIMETFTGQTIGKMATDTIVVDKNKLKPGPLRILLRTILRLNPLDSLSYLFGQEQGSHDIISRTRLKLDKDIKQ